MIDPRTLHEVAESCCDYATHKGVGFMASIVSAADGFDVAVPLSFLLTTPDTNMRIHISAHAESNTPAILSVYEDTGVAAEFNVTAGTAQRPVNRDRNVRSNRSKVTLVHTPTITAAAVAARIHARTAGKAGGSPSFKIILRRNTSYLFTFVSLAADNEGSLNLTWAEAIDADWNSRVKVLSPSLSPSVSKSISSSLSASISDSSSVSPSSSISCSASASLSASPSASLSASPSASPSSSVSCSLSSSPSSSVSASPSASPSSSESLSHSVSLSISKSLSASVSPSSSLSSSPSASVSPSASLSASPSASISSSPSASPSSSNSPSPS